jgi:Domain of unknown function (DUF4780)
MEREKGKKRETEEDSEMSDSSTTSTVRGGEAQAMDSPNRNVGATQVADDTPVVEKLSGELQKVDLQRKRPSGAQRRKFVREQKKAAGKWTEKKPHKPSRQGGSGRPATEPSRKSLGKDSRKETPKQGGRDEGKKRPRLSDDTPPQAREPKRIRSVNQQTGSFRDATRNLGVAIIDRRYPETQLDQGQANLIQTRLEEEVFNTPGGSEDIIQFQRTTFASGALWVTCGNEYTKAWLGERVRALGQPWEGAELTTVDSKNLPRRPIVLAFVQDSAPEETVVRTRLGQQNKGLRTGDWLLKSRKVEKDGQTLTYSIDEASYRALEAANFKAYYGLGRVAFKVLRGLDGGGQSGSNQPPTQ